MVPPPLFAVHPTLHRAMALDSAFAIVPAYEQLVNLRNGLKASNEVWPRFYERDPTIPRWLLVGLMAVIRTLLHQTVFADLSPSPPPPASRRWFQRSLPAYTKPRYTVLQLYPTKISPVGVRFDVRRADTPPGGRPFQSLISTSDETPLQPETVQAAHLGSFPASQPPVQTLCDFNHSPDIAEEHRVDPFCLVLHAAFKLWEYRFYEGRDPPTVPPELLELVLEVHDLIVWQPTPTASAATEVDPTSQAKFPPLLRSEVYPTVQQPNVTSRGDATSARNLSEEEDGWTDSDEEEDDEEDDDERDAAYYEALRTIKATSRDPNRVAQAQVAMLSDRLREFPLHIQCVLACLRGLSKLLSLSAAE